ncbi:MAG TPA: hypothetical protein VGE14_04560 [Marmoricola sp.]
MPTTTARPADHAVRIESAAEVSAADIVEIWGQDSFPASDPPTNW